jgi:hypothetical protein
LASGETRRYWPDGRVATSWIFSKIAGLGLAAAVDDSARFHRAASSETFGF